MPKKRRNSRQAEIEKLETALCLNGQAIQEGPKRKSWSMHDLANINPLTPTQEDMFHAWFNGYNVCAHGSPGTGKTFLALYLALNEVLSKRQRKIILVRSAVPTREIGFLPGSMEDKMMQYELPYHDILWELLERPTSYQDMKDAGVIEFHSTSFLRGLTWDNAIVLVDEAENLSFHEINSVMTRIGKNTRIILTGDTAQTDLDGTKRMGAEGLSEAMEAFRKMTRFECVNFGIHDIVRSDDVKSWIIASNQAA